MRFQERRWPVSVFLTRKYDVPYTAANGVGEMALKAVVDFLACRQARCSRPEEKKAGACVPDTTVKNR
jgi:hypothetical protein